MNSNYISNHGSFLHVIIHSHISHNSTYNVCEYRFILFSVPTPPTFLAWESGSEKENNTNFLCLDIADEDVHGLFFWWKSLCYSSKYVQDQDGARMVILFSFGLLHCTFLLSTPACLVLQSNIYCIKQTPLIKQQHIKWPPLNTRTWPVVKSTSVECWKQKPYWLATYTVHVYNAADFNLTWNYL